MVHLRAENLSLDYQVQRKWTLRRGPQKASPTGQIETRGSQQFVSALKDVSFELNAGDRLGLVGPNGAGKTTLLKVLYGIYEPTSGQVDVTGRIDALFNITLGFRPEATGRRNIELRGLINGWHPRQIEERMDEIIAFSELGEFIDMPYKTYSQGMGARLAFSVATALEPEILLMDEWIGAGDRAFQAKAQERMQQMADKAGIIVLASHSQDLIDKTCNKILYMEKGRAQPIVDMAG